MNVMPTRRRRRFHRSEPRGAAWAQQKATPDELEMVTDALLLAMHDLRAVLVRKKADRLPNSDED